MTKQKFVYILCFLIGSASGYFITRAYLKTEPAQKSTTITKDRIITKTVRVKAKDGSSTTTIERAQDRTRQATKAVMAKKNYFVGATYDTKQAYGLVVQRRLVGDVYGLLQLTTDQRVSIGLGVAF